MTPPRFTSVCPLKADEWGVRMVHALEQEAELNRLVRAFQAEGEPREMVRQLLRRAEALACLMEFLLDDPRAKQIEYTPEIVWMAAALTRVSDVVEPAVREWRSNA